MDINLLMNPTPPRSKIIPHIHLLCLQRTASQAFLTAIQSHNLTNSITYTIHESSLSQLSPSLTFDAVVSPANSHGLLDGGFDDAISRAWSPKNDYTALARALQADLYRLYRGFQPPGTCHLFRIPEHFRGTLRYNDAQGWGCKYLAHCPTMRVPSDCVWDREVMYECIWSLLCSVGNHNRDVKSDGPGGEGELIESILMTPLGTGTGGVSLERWAGQMALAIKHYIEAVERPEVWACLDWPKAMEVKDEVAEHHKQ